MANQAIALQARAPQGNILGPALQQGAQMVNMMRQQEAADRQAAATNQQLALAQAEEAHKAAMRPLQMDQARATLAATQGGEEREAALQPFALNEAEARARQAEIKTLSDFYGLSYDRIKNAKNLNDVVIAGNSLKNTFKNPMLQDAVDQTLATLPKNPADFPAWREETLFNTLTNVEQLKQRFQTQTTGEESRVIAMPEYGGGPRGVTATEVPGSRIQAAQGLTYSTDASGNIITLPSKMPGTGGFDSASPVKVALQTNPGALKDGPFAQAQRGYAGSSGGFATFNTPEAGIAAQENLLRSAYVNKGVNTIDKIINRYAPPGPENSAASVANYKNYIRQRTGIDTNAPITAAQVPKVAAAMREFETGQRPGGGATANTGVSNIQLGQPIAGTGKARKASAQAYSAMVATMAKYDQTIKRAESLRDSKGLDGIVGNIEGNIPAPVLSVTSQEKANALAKYDSLLATAGFQELQQLRDASETGGALGNVSNSENTLTQNAAFTTSRTQSKPEFVKSLNTYINDLKASQQRLKDAYQLEYGSSYTSPSSPARNAPPPPPARNAPAPTRGSNIDALLKKYGG